MKNYLYAFSSVTLIAILYMLNPFAGDPKAKEEAIIKAVKTYLEQVHYQPQDLNDEFSAKAFDLYVDYLDGGKRFLTQNEINKLSEYRMQVDDELKNNTLLLFNESNIMIEEGIDRAERIFREVIDYNFDFTKDEVIEMDPDKKDFPADDEELKDSWRKALKYDILVKLHKKLEAQEKAQEKSNDTDVLEDTEQYTPAEKAENEKNDDNDVKEEKIKSVDELIKESRQEVKDNFEDWFKRLEKVRRSDRFESYVNAIMHVYDPHSDYYNPKEKADFDIRMSGKLEGIGARLSPDGEYIKVVSIVPGGPAWKGKELEVEDLISKVTQEGQEPLNIEGMRLDDVVSKIRGKKGTVVILTVKKPDGSFKDVRIERDVVITEEGNAKSVLLNLEGVSEKIGYTYLPSFYADFKSKDGRSCSKDIAAELEKLKDQNVDGIILDIRNNGGGSLRDVVDMAGLFVEKGPMVQVKPKGKAPYVLEDEDPTVQYDGPLIIMTNDFSVSASEILAAALQDYKRAVIVGSPSTFGKGSVQRFFSLDRGVRGVNDFKPLGDVKMTIQKFFRIDGTSTQLKGVEADIVLPDSYFYIKRGEKDYDHPLEWTEIENVEHKQNAYVIDNYDELKSKSKSRVDTNDEFQLILENAKRLKDNRDDRVYSLELETFRGDLKEKSKNAKKFKNLGKNVITGLDIQNLAVDMDHIQSDSSRIGRNQDFITRLTKDIYLKETIHIMDDMIEN